MTELQLFQRAFLSTLLMVLLSACGGSGSEQRCNPKTNSGCSSGQACAVDGTGTAVCSTDQGLVEEGALCQPPVLNERSADIDLSERCAAGLGCISHQGVSRCLRFCDPDGSTNQCAAATEHPLGRFGQCSIILDDRPDIGACALPCNLGDPDNSACPDGTQCRLVIGASVAHCGTVGSQVLGAGCGPGCQCGPGLVCIRDPFGQSCRQVADEAATCSEENYLSALPGSRDPTANLESDLGSPYLICTPCKVVRGDGLSLCARESGCRADGGLLGSVNTANAGAIRSAIELHEGQGAVLVGARQDTDGTWVWDGTGQAVEENLWDGDEVPNGGDCVRLNSSGRLEVSSECAVPALCLRTIRQPCAP